MPVVTHSPVFFRTPDAFRRWLARHGSGASALLVGFYKVGSGRPSLTWSEAVDEALCFGWIDGVRKRIDDESYQIRFTPRRPNSVWSAINLAKVEALVSQGRMQAAGLVAFSHRKNEASRVYSYDRQAPPTLSPDDLGRFQAHAVAWRFFGSTPPGYQRLMVHWVVSAKLPATRSRRLSRLIDACANGKRLLP